jgi:hypothetical protein
MKKKRKSLLAAEQAMENLLKRVRYKKPCPSFSIHEIPSYKVESNLPKLSDSVCGQGSKKPEQTYSGSELLGVAVSHKSNLLPISKNGNDAIEVSKMRRQ